MPFTNRTSAISGHDEKSDKPHKYVKPRIGSQFQVDILPYVRPSDSVTQSASETETFRSETSAPVFRAAPPLKKRGRPPKNKAVSRINSIDSLASKVSSADSKRSSLPKNPLSSSSAGISGLGGVCIHRPKHIKAENETNVPSYEQYLAFARNLMLQMPQKSSHTSRRADHLWKEALSNKSLGEPENYNSSTGTSGSRRGRKRKMELPDDDDMAWGLLASKSGNNVPQSPQNEKPPLSTPSVNPQPTSQLIGLENDEQMLEYLQVRHNGNINRAQLVTLSQLSMGQADKARRYQLKLKKEEDENGGPLAAVFAPFSISWHRRYDMISSTMHGDLRRRPGVMKYLYYTVDETNDGSHTLFPWMLSAKSENNKFKNMKEDNSQIKQDDTKLQSTESNSNINDLDEDLAKEWRSLLEYGQMFMKKIEKKESPAPSLNDILLLIGKAYSIKKPEDVFGKRDSTPKHISICMNGLMDYVEISRKLLSNLIDSLHDAKGEGVDIDVLTKKLNEMRKNSKLHLHEFETVSKMLKDSSRWESKLSCIGNADDSDESSMSIDLHQPQESLHAVEKLAHEAKSLILRPKSLVVLEERISRATSLRDRIQKWKKESNDQSENVKYISSMIKEANRISLNFPELSILSRLHRNAEEWIDRSTIAIRSKISLNELQELLEKGEKMPVDLSDLLEKLRSRAGLAIDWINRLHIEVPGPESSNRKDRNDVQAEHRSEWFLRMRETFKNGSDDQIRSLMELASNGMRIPVEIECLHLLQSAVEFRNWSLKAKRWIPLSSGEPSRRGKIEDINDHLRIANIIRNKVQTDSNQSEREHWKLDFEDDLKTIVQRANEWNSKYREYLEGDNRKAQGRCRVSFDTLQKIVEEAEEIPANLGNALVKMNRILSQAITWVKEHYGILQKCGIKINFTPMAENQQKPTKFSFERVSVAVENGQKNLSVDLVEVQELQDIGNRAQRWYDRALMFAPKRSKRNVRGKKVPESKHNLDEIVSLIDEAARLPVDTTEDLERLKIQLSGIQSWRLQAQCDIRAIVDAFVVLRTERIAFYGIPSKFDDIVPSLRNINMPPVASPTATSNGIKKSGDFIDNNTTELTQRNPALKVPGGGKAVYKLISNFLKASRAMIFRTVEEKIAERLDFFGIWCRKAAIIIASPNDIYTDKKWIKDLGNLVNDGEKFVGECVTLEGIDKDQFDDKVLLRELFDAASSVIRDDISRLMVLCSRRDDFYSWCEKVEAIFTDPEKKLSQESLQDLNKEASIFPSSVETVKQIQKELHATNSFSKSTKSLLKSGRKISIEDAKKLVLDGEKLKVTCQEFKTIKNALRVARLWQKRVKACCSDQVSTQISQITALIDEHDTLTISMPDDIANLRQTMCSYCLCRRPYDGFMIGCDECEEWYHGQCIGISESQAEKFDRFVCVRCCLKKAYKNTSHSAGCLIRKWSNDGELSKARQNDSQKHHRKVKRDLREKAKILKQIDECQKKLGLSNEALESHTQNQTNSEIQLKNTDTKFSDNIGDKSQPDRAQLLENDSADGSAISKDDTPSNEQTVIIEPKGGEQNSNDAVNTKLNKATASLENYVRRLTRLNEALNDRKIVEQKEDAVILYLRQWFLLVKTNVFFSESKSDLLVSFPSFDGSLTPSMISMIEKAEQNGIKDLPDVCSMINSFKCLSWCLNAFSILRRKPRLKEMHSLVTQSENIQLPEEKGVKMLRSIIQRASNWQSKISKALISIPGETKKFDLELLHQLRVQLKDVPMIMPEEQLILNSLDDGGIRYCLCGGPSDGGFMLSCDKCDKWFHGTCVHLDKETGDKLSKWICPKCENSDNISMYEQTVNKIVEERKQGHWRFLDYVADVKMDDVSQNAPDPAKLWPPFGKVDSAEAAEIFGDTLNIQAVTTIKHPTKKQGSHSTTLKLPLAKRLVRTVGIVDKLDSESTPTGDQQLPGPDTYVVVNKESSSKRHEPPPSSVIQNNTQGFGSSQSSNRTNSLSQTNLHPPQIRADSNINHTNKLNPIFSQNHPKSSLNNSNMAQSSEKSSNSPTPMTNFHSDSHQPLTTNSSNLDMSGRLHSQPKLPYAPMISNNITISQHNTYSKPLNNTASGATSTYPMSSNSTSHQSFHSSQHISRMNQSHLPSLGSSTEYSKAPFKPHVNQNQFTQQDPKDFTFSQQKIPYHQNGISGKSPRHIDLKYQNNSNSLNAQGLLSKNINGQNGINYPINHSNSYIPMEKQIHLSNISRQQQIINNQGNPSFASSRNTSDNMSVNQPFLDRSQNSFNPNQNFVNNNSSISHQNEAYLQRRFSPIQTNIDPNTNIPNLRQSTTPPNSNTKYMVDERRSPHPPQNFPQAGYQRGIDTIHFATNGVNNANGGQASENSDQLYSVGPNGQPYR